MRQNAVRLSRTIEESIKYEMLIARSDYVQRTLEDIGRQEGIEHIRIFDKKGKIIAADSMQEIGMLIDRQAEACHTCHREREPLRKLSSPDMTRVFRSEKGTRMLGIINPIYNEPRCSNAACHAHPKDQKVLGVMDIVMSLARFDQQIATSRKQIVIYFIFTFLFISTGISLFVFLFVNTPIRKLIEGTRKIAAGDLNSRIGSYHSDEIGELGKSFDQMTAELKKSREENERWNLHLRNEVKKATERLRKANEKLNAANKKLRDLDNMKSDFMRRMEHGSRSHLAVIQSCLSLVLGEYYSELSEQQKDIIKTAERRSATLLELLDDILLLSYRKSTRDVYHLESVRLEDIMRKVLDDIQAQAQQRNIVVDVHLPPDLPRVLADQKALDEVFSNLLNNAVKYTQDHGAICLSARQIGDFIEIDVKDTGIGIASKDLPKIFDEFYRAPNARAYKIEGTGVGLAIVKEIVEAHRGELRVQSQPGKGSTFTVSFPKAD
ncbi:MAG: HAMP domain-containing sensor histidine kinase, partial [Acidobacteriota bacterium]